ncbi:MAG: DUF4160 domain-containing protein [Deltaproteobacteria bacterium]|nr:DUF4160 domain-containing protein [Deltaproteobacteria bacterium]
MPVISMFYGIVIMMYPFDNDKHHLPHVHIRYQEQEAVFSIETGDLLEGNLRSNKKKLVEAWIELRREDLLTDWQLAVQGHPIFNIEPLK